MARRRWVRLVLGCALVLLGAWWGVSRWLSGAGPAEAQAATESLPDLDRLIAESELPAALVTSKPLQRQLAILASRRWPANPFVPTRAANPLKNEAEGVESASEKTEWVLSALVSGSPPLALINGRVVTVGDRLADGSKLTSIGPFSVSLEGPQGPWILALPD